MSEQTTTTLQNVNLKITKARKVLIAIFLEAQKPLDVQTVITLLKNKKITADEATVYRTLNTFIENNILNKVELREGKARYELASLPHHHHAVCLECGKIQDIGECKITDIEKRVVREFKFSVQSHQIEVFGLCYNCQKLLKKKK